MSKSRITPEGIKLLGRLPQKYWERFLTIEKEKGLIDNCKYMLYLQDGWALFEDCGTIPVKNISEAIKVIKDSYNYYENQKKDVFTL